MKTTQEKYDELKRKEYRADMRSNALRFRSLISPAGFWNASSFATQIQHAGSALRCAISYRNLTQEVS